MKGGTFRSTQWDPFLLTAQIIAMQSLLYVSLGIVMCFMEMIVGDGTNHTLNHLFQYHVSILLSKRLLSPVQVLEKNNLADNKDV